MSKLKEYGGLIATLIVMVVAGVAAGSTVVSADGPPEGPDQRQNLPAKGSHVLSSQLADARGESPWAVRTYRSLLGLSCFESGQVRDGQFGRHIAGSFRSSGEDQPSGLCLKLSDNPVGAALAFDHRGTGEKETVDRSILSGIVEDRVASISVTYRGETQQLAPDRKNRSVLAVFPGQIGFADAAVTINYRDGTTVQLPRKLATP